MHKEITPLALQIGFSGKQNRDGSALDQIKSWDKELMTEKDGRGEKQVPEWCWILKVTPDAIEMDINLLEASLVSAGGWNRCQNLSHWNDRDLKAFSFGFGRMWMEHFYQTYNYSKLTEKLTLWVRVHRADTLGETLTQSFFGSMMIFVYFSLLCDPVPGSEEIHKAKLSHRLNAVGRTPITVCWVGQSNWFLFLPFLLQPPGDCPNWLL